VHSINSASVHLLDSAVVQSADLLLYVRWTPLLNSAYTIDKTTRGSVHSHLPGEAEESHENPSVACTVAFPNFQFIVLFR
jgi:hypothetical protein